MMSSESINIVTRSHNYDPPLEKKNDNTRLKPRCVYVAEKGERLTKEGENPNWKDSKGPKQGKSYPQPILYSNLPWILLASTGTCGFDP